MKEVADEIRDIVKMVEPRLTSLQSDPELGVRPHPKKWSRKEILGHLIDSACNNQQKFVRMSLQSHLEFPGYRQDDWVDAQKWASASWQDMITLWSAYNRHIAWLIESLNSDCWNNTIMIEGVGPFTLKFIMPDYVEHLKHHINQIFPDIDLDSSFVNVYNA